MNSTFICKFKDHILPDSVPAVVNDIVQQAGVSTRHIYTTAFRGFSARMSATAASNLVMHNPNVVYCEPNALIKAGAPLVQPGKGQGSGGGQVPPVEEFIPRGGCGRTQRSYWAYCLDPRFRFDLDNPDLNVDASRGFDAVKIKGKGTVDDVYGHGTHVAGIDYVAQKAQSGEVANMSAWWWDHHQAFHEAASSLANIIPFVVIAGNDGADLNEKPSEPAHVEHSNLITVSAVDHWDNFADFSNWGYAGDDLPRCDETSSSYTPFLCATVDYAAPGVDVTSLQPDGSLATWWGTSMAAPHVAGIILLLQHTMPTSPPNIGGFAKNDPDGQQDPIAIH